MIISRAKSSATSDEPAWWLKPLAEPQAELVTDAADLSSAEARSQRLDFHQLADYHASRTA